jgi:hypothetical protein
MSVHVQLDAAILNSTNMWDVLALDETNGEEDSNLETIASFATYSSASEWARDQERYVVAIRPPRTIASAAQEWLQFAFGLMGTYELELPVKSPYQRHY